jgi:hypothetical protein
LQQTATIGILGAAPALIAEKRMLSFHCHALPTMYLLREFTAAGGLISYGASMTEAYRQAGIYAGGILKGVPARRAADHPANQV